MGVSSRTIRDRLKEEPEYLNALTSISQGKVAPVPGGVRTYYRDSDTLRLAALAELSLLFFVNRF